MKTALFDVTWKSGLVKGEDYGSSEYFLVFSSGGSNASNCRHTFISQAFKEISLSRLPDLAQRSHPPSDLQGWGGATLDVNTGNVVLAQEFGGLKLGGDFHEFVVC